MIQYLGEHKLFNEKYIIFILFCIFLIEFKSKRSIGGTLVDLPIFLDN